MKTELLNELVLLLLLTESMKMTAEVTTDCCFDDKLSEVDYAVWTREISDWLTAEKIALGIK
ncbi:hypothetical protein [Candidatus Methanomassiliicoccus intestinalis]|uniref:hypothetical protein n=1 Tax=Candidatus Methanomassiliicoccus intestinalis TaxID=1406512 RepID=UPI0037DC1151